MLSITVVLRGPFRQYLKEDSIELEVNPGSTLKECKNQMGATLRKYNPQFDNDALINHSAFANTHEILKDDFCLTENTVLNIIPPVCGG